MNTKCIDLAKAEQLLERLRSFEAKGRDLSTEEYNEAVRSVVEQEIATPLDLARLFHVSISTIDRWQRISAPAPGLRTATMTVLIKLVEDALT